MSSGETLRVPGTVYLSGEMELPAPAIAAPDEVVVPKAASGEPTGAAGTSPTATESGPESGGPRRYRFIASTNRPDRAGDVVEQTGWQLSAYRRNPVVLYGHDSRALPIGRATDVAVIENRLEAEIDLAQPGRVPFVDMVRNLIEERILRAVSVGFRPIRTEPIRDSSGNLKGYRFLEQELVEISIVPVPMNGDALAVLRSFNAPRDLVATLDAVCAPTNRAASGPGLALRWRQFDLLRLRARRPRAAPDGTSPAGNPSARS